MKGFFIAPFLPGESPGIFSHRIRNQSAAHKGDIKAEICAEHAMCIKTVTWVGPIAPFCPHFRAKTCVFCLVRSARFDSESPMARLARHRESDHFLIRSRTSLISWQNTRLCGHGFPREKKRSSQTSSFSTSITCRDQEVPGNVGGKCLMTFFVPRKMTDKLEMFFRFQHKKKKFGPHFGGGCQSSWCSRISSANRKSFFATNG